jgi:hypothetical protein
MSNQRLILAVIVQDGLVVSLGDAGGFGPERRGYQVPLVGGGRNQKEEPAGFLLI